MGLSIVIPVRNLPECTDECIERLITYSVGDIDVIVIDNGSDVPYTNTSPFVRVLRNEKNIGFWPSMLQGIEAAYYSIVQCQHNDVFVWEPSFDQTILSEFEKDPLLCTAGFFGGKGVCILGGRGYPMGRMLGKKYGTPQRDHGYWIDIPTPAVVFDSLAMIFRKELLYTLNPENIVPHHFTDRIVTIRTVRAGYHALCIPVMFDHGGSFTASSGALNTFTEDWCKENGLEFDQNWDYTLYMHGLKQYQTEFRYYFGSNADQLWVGGDYVYAVKDKE